MPFPKVGREDILDSLRGLGVVQGDCIYVSSFMAILGNGATLLDDTINALLQAVGPPGTVVMPAFNWDYCEGSVFDVEETPAKTGVLSEAFRMQLGVVRSTSPPWATFCAFGAEAKQITSIHSRSPFGPDSIAQYMVDANVKYVLIGCSFDKAVFHIHWLEEKYNVPYRFWKEFKGNVRVRGELVEDVSQMYARYLDTEVDVVIDASRLTTAFKETGMIRSAQLGLGELLCFNTQDYVEFMDPFFEQDSMVVLVPEAKAQFE